MTARSRRAVTAVAALVLGTLALVAWEFAGFHVREVIPGICYRSKQPSPSQLADAARKYHIRSVINLRGRNPRDRWWQEERDACAANHLREYDIPFSSRDWPAVVEVRQLVSALDSAPHPYLMHCETGNDRSGWASAVALLLSGRSLAAARRQLSIRYGHVCGKHCRLDEFFDMYANYLARVRPETESAETFRKWATTIYAPEPYNADIRVTEHYGAPLSAAPGGSMRTEVSVRNLSSSRWRTTSPNGPGIRLGGRILGPFEAWPADPAALFRVPRVKAVDVYRDSTVRNVEPGGVITTEPEFKAPSRPGKYVVQFDMVDEGVHWFSDVGTPGSFLQIEVR